MTKDELSDFCRRIDTLPISAASMPELYRKMNTLESNSRGGWRPLRAPFWVGERLVMMLIRSSLDK